MKLKQLPEPTILIWDCKNSNIPTYYPCLVGEHHKSKLPPQTLWRKVYGPNSDNWMQESEYLREPTVQEHIVFRNQIDQLLLKYKEQLLNEKV